MFRCIKAASFAVSVLALSTLSSSTVAMPANPEPRTLVQPDGAQFQAVPHGDERMLWYKTVDTGEIVVFNPLSQSYEYAEVETALGDTFLRPSGLLFGQTGGFSIPQLNPQDLMAAWQSAWEDFEDSHDHGSHNHGSESAPESASGNAGPSGSVSVQSGQYVYNTLFIMIEFNDFQFVSDEAVWADKTFGGYPGNSITAGSLNDYYQEISDGQLFFTPANETQGTANDGFVKVQLNINHPQYARNWSGWRDVLRDAFNAAAPHVDFSQYDTNQNGSVDKTELLVSFIVAGKESSYYGSETEGFWGHAYFSHSFGTFDGVNVSTGYMGFGERQGGDGEMYDSTLGIIAHEFGHSAFNLRDLYNQPAAISYWGLMGSGSWGYKSGERLGARPVHMTAYSKMNVYLQGGNYGFFQPTDINANGAAQLITTSHPFDASSYDFFRVAGEANHKYWLIEQRKVQGYDEGLLRNGGTYTGNMQAGDTGILVSYTDSSSRLFIQRMDGESNGTKKTNMLYAGNATTFSPNTTPSSNYPGSGDFSGLWIEQVSAPADRMTAYVRKEAFPCTSVTATLPNHETAGRVYSIEEGTWWKVDRFYANGSGEDLGTSTWTQVTLNETAPGYFTTAACPTEDTTPPSITLTGASEITIYQNSSWSEPGYSANDSNDGDISANVVVTGSVNTAVIGDYTLGYNVSDAAGNAATEVTRLVHVVSAPQDTTPPTITLLGDALISINVGDSFSDPGATANDNIDGDITSSIVVTGSVNTNVIGDYTLRYNVSDAAGNAATEVTRLVQVVEPSSNCVEYTSTVTQHINAGRAYTCGTYSFNGCAVGSDTDIGLTFLTTQVTLKEEPAGYFDLGSCN